VDLADLLTAVLSEFLSDYLEWWIDQSMNQYEKLATSEMRRIGVAILQAYADNKKIKKEDLKAIMDKSLYYVKDRKVI
jgi:hypothetical protein